MSSSTRTSLYHRWLGWHAPSRRRAAGVLVLGLVVAVVLSTFLPWESAAILGWDAAGLTFLFSVRHLILHADAKHVARLASRVDETRADATVLLATVCMVSLLSVGYTLHAARLLAGTHRALLIVLAMGTVAVSWTVLNTVYTLRYAHLYYGLTARAIDFGEGDGQDASAHAPTYRDFAYVALTVGMTYQVSDTTLRDPRLRRSVIVHALLSYVFGVVIIAGVVNLIAGLFG